MNARANILILSDNLNPFNVGVLGSSPRRITKKSELLPQNAENHLISSVFVFALSGRIQRFSEHKRE